MSVPSKTGQMPYPRVKKNFSLEIVCYVQRAWLILWGAVVSLGLVLLAVYSIPISLGVCLFFSLVFMPLDVVLHD